MTPEEAELIDLKTGITVKGFTRKRDRSGFIHNIKNRGNERIEALRGQIAVTNTDFEKILKIGKSESLIYPDKAKIGLDCILYETTINNTFYFVE